MNVCAANTSQNIKSRLVGFYIYCYTARLLLFAIDAVAVVVVVVAILFVLLCVLFSK